MGSRGENMGFTYLSATLLLLCLLDPAASLQVRPRISDVRATSDARLDVAFVTDAEVGDESAQVAEDAVLDSARPSLLQTSESEARLACTPTTHPNARGGVDNSCCYKRCYTTKINCDKMAGQGSIYQEGNDCDGRYKQCTLSCSMPGSWASR